MTTHRKTAKDKTFIKIWSNYKGQDPAEYSDSQWAIYLTTRYMAQVETGGDVAFFYGSTPTEVRAKLKKNKFGDKISEVKLSFPDVEEYYLANKEIINKQVCAFLVAKAQKSPPPKNLAF